MYGVNISEHFFYALELHTDMFCTGLSKNCSGNINHCFRGELLCVCDLLWSLVIVLSAKCILPVLYPASFTSSTMLRFQSTMGQRLNDNTMLQHCNTPTLPQRYCITVPTFHSATASPYQHYSTIIPMLYIIQHYCITVPTLQHYSTNGPHGTMAPHQISYHLTPLHSTLSTVTGCTRSTHLGSQQELQCAAAAPCRRFIASRDPTAAGRSRGWNSQRGRGAGGTRR